MVDILTIQRTHARGTTKDGFNGYFSYFLDYFFSFVVAIFDLVHHMEAIFNPRLLLKASANGNVAMVTAWQ